MTIQAQLADGRVLEFPDGTDPAVIQATVKRVIAEQPSTDVQPDQASQPVDQVTQTEQQEPTFGQRALGTLETGLGIATAAIAEPAAGIAGLLTAPFVGVDGAVENIDAVRQALTFQPRTESGQEQQLALAEIVRPVAEGLETAENFLGEAVLDATGSPELAAIAHSLPTAFLEAIGVKGLKGTRLANQKLSPNVSRAIQQAAPDIDTIKARTTQAYNELDNLGIRIRPDVYERFATNLQTRLQREGLDPTLTPKSQAAIDRIVGDIGQAKTLSELETLRKIAGGAARSIDPPDSRLGTMIVSEIDDALDQLSTQIGGQFKQARGLAQRGIKSRTIEDMIENATHTASGLENGLRIEARKILKNPKNRKGFTKDEIAALKQIEQGTTAANAAKFLGKFGISDRQATSMLGFSIGAGGGGAIGSFFGPGGAALGAISVPILADQAKKTARRLTLNNARFANDLVRSGRNAKQIVRAYLKNTPVKERNVSDLTDLLLTEGVTVDSIRALPKSAGPTSKLVADAKFFAEELKRRAQRTAATGLVLQPDIDAAAVAVDEEEGQ